MARKKKVTDEMVDNHIEELQKKNEVVEIEKFYVNSTISNLDEMIEKKEKEMVTMLEEYEKMMTVEVKDENGEVIDTYMRQSNPYLISTYFFKSINPLNNIEPQYSSEKLGVVWSLYMSLIEQVNINIGAFQPTISSFCRFAGITTATLKNYRNSGDIQMQTVVNKIFDETFDSNVLLAQTKVLSNRSTELRVKVENEVQEKPQVRVNVNVGTEVDLNQISSRLKEIKNFKANKYSQDEIEVDYEQE